MQAYYIPFLMLLRHDQARHMVIQRMNDMDHHAEVQRLSQNNRIWVTKIVLEPEQYLN